MALTSLASLFLVILSNIIILEVNAALALPKGHLDKNKRNAIVDEAFMDQKDVLLEMLETKLKEVRDKKKDKKKMERMENSLFHNNNNGENVKKCESLIKNADLKIKANGIVAVGESEITLKFGNTGKGALNLDASGISNVGKAHLDLSVGNGNNINIPGLSNIFIGKLSSLCNNENENIGREGEIKENVTLNVTETRRSNTLESNQTANVTNSNTTDITINVESNTVDVASVTVAGNNTTVEVVTAPTEISVSSTVARNATDLSSTTVKT